MPHHRPHHLTHHLSLTFTTPPALTPQLYEWIVTGFPPQVRVIAYTMSTRHVPFAASEVVSRSSGSRVGRDASSVASSSMSRGVPAQLPSRSTLSLWPSSSHEDGVENEEERVYAPRREPNPTHRPPSQVLYPYASTQSRNPYHSRRDVYPNPFTTRAPITPPQGYHAPAPPPSLSSPPSFPVHPSLHPSSTPTSRLPTAHVPPSGYGNTLLHSQHGRWLLYSVLEAGDEVDEVDEVCRDVRLNRGRKGREESPVGGAGGEENGSDDSDDYDSRASGCLPCFFCGIPLRVAAWR